LDDNAAFEELKTSDETPEHDQKIIFLDKILSKLTVNYRKVLELRFLKGYTIAETSDELNLTEENVKVLQHRALKKANQLTKEAEDTNL